MAFESISPVTPKINTPVGTPLTGNRHTHCCILFYRLDHVSSHISTMCLLSVFLASTNRHNPSSNIESSLNKPMVNTEINGWTWWFSYYQQIPRKVCICIEFFCAMKLYFCPENTIMSRTCSLFFFLFDPTYPAALNDHTCIKYFTKCTCLLSFGVSFTKNYNTQLFMERIFSFWPQWLSWSINQLIKLYFYRSFHTA